MSASDQVLRFFHAGAIATVAAAARALILLAAALPLLIAWLWRALLKLREDGGRDQEEEQKDCHVPFPEDLMRRPDPCIYSQFYLMAQGVPVTWDNPDIRVARAETPGTIEPDSYNLQADTDYLVFVQVHNAGADLALGVRVRLVYRPWSFNSPDLLPVETDGSGGEAFRTVNVPPVGSTVTTFKWRTPKVEAGGSAHFCLQAILSHPMDTNTGNNLGQENTQVLGAEKTSAKIVVPLHNPARVAQRFTIEATRYAVDEKEMVGLHLTYSRGRPRDDPARRIAALVPTMALDVGSPGAKSILGLEWSADAPTVKAKYVGMEPLRDRLRKQDVSLPRAFKVEVTDGGVALAPKETRDVEITLTPPAGAAPGKLFAINLVARDEGRWPVGGVTVLLTVRR